MSTPRDSHKGCFIARVCSADDQGPLVEIVVKSPYFTFTVKYGRLGVFGMNFSQMPLDFNVYYTKPLCHFRKSVKNNLYHKIKMKPVLNKCS